MGRLGRRGKVPTIRILILGAEGVGKNSLESRVGVLSLLFFYHVGKELTRQTVHHIDLPTTV